MRLRNGWWSLRHRTDLPAAHSDPTTDRRGSSGLAAVLDAAAGPPRNAERAGEDAAIAAYRAARTGARSRPTVQSPALPWVRAGAWVVAIAVAGTAGAALATGGPNPDGAARSTAGTGRAPAVSPAPAATPDLMSSPTRSPSPTRTGRPGPAAALAGHCTAYLANGGQPGKALSSAAFRELIEAAGGLDRVAAYCRGLVASQKPKPSRPGPGAGGPPSYAPSHRP